MPSEAPHVQPFLWIYRYTERGECERFAIFCKVGFRKTDNYYHEVVMGLKTRAEAERFIDEGKHIPLVKIMLRDQQER